MCFMGKGRIQRIQNVVISCQGADCRKAGAKKLRACAKRVVRDMGCNRNTMMVKTKCTGLCKQAPVMIIQPANEFVTQATPRSVEKALRDNIRD